jgi:hypothetical protein
MTNLPMMALINNIYGVFMMGFIVVMPVMCMLALMIVVSCLYVVYIMSLVTVKSVGNGKSLMMYAALFLN